MYDQTGVIRIFRTEHSSGFWSLRARIPRPNSEEIFEEKKLIPASLCYIGQRKCLLQGSVVARKVYSLTGCSCFEYFMVLNVGYCTEQY